MSDQTPDIQDDLSGGEPSMEDILASIRKIIADDDVTTALDSPEVGLSELKGTLNSESDAISEATVDMVEPLTLAEDAILNNVEDGVEGNDFEFDLVVDEAPGFIDLEIPDIPSDSSAENIQTDRGSASVEEVADDGVLSDLNKLLAEVEVETSETAAVNIDKDASLDMPILEAETADLVEVEVKTEQSVMDEIEDLLSSVEDDALEDDLVEEVAFTDELGEPELNASEEDEDLNLVKSLIADLTDSDESTEEQADFEALLDEEADASSDEEDILDQILNMTLEDELASVETDAEPESLTVDDIVEMEAENTHLNTDHADTAAPSLSDIAASAEADAKGAGIAAVGALAGITAGAAALGEPNEAEHIEEETASEGMDVLDRILEVVETDDVEPAPVETAQEETPEMARTAAKKDTIIEGATAAATADAFASLNKVVEEKAVKAERGDRIGDLVMEALQPMLKEWLDANLKGIVERAVTKEVKRISTGK